jgi:hypothetical protein
MRCHASQVVIKNGHDPNEAGQEGAQHSWIQLGQDGIGMLSFLIGIQTVSGGVLQRILYSVSMT